MTALLRRLSPEGLAALRAFLAGDADDPAERERILFNTATAERLPEKVEVETREFASRLEAAQHLTELFANVSLDVDNDAGLWGWLALFHFAALCPKDRWRPGAPERWILAGAKYYRHLLAGPFRIYRLYDQVIDKAMVVLCQPVHEPGQFVDYLASSPQLITNRAVIEVATSLYYDPRTGKLKRGCYAGHKPGTVRRFVDVLRQLDATWDLYSLSAGRLLALLPREFARFRKVRPQRRRLRRAN
jgi:hypothetical protein